MFSRPDKEIAVAVITDLLDDDKLRRRLKKKLRPKLPAWFPIGRILRYLLPALREEIKDLLLDDGR